MSVLQSNEIYDSIKAELASRYLSRNSLLDYTKYTMEDFEATSFHETYYKILDKFCKAEIKRLMVTIGPQNGKSEGSSRRLPSYILGKNPDTKIALASYASSFAQEFSLEIQRIIQDDPYHILFPDIELASSKAMGKGKDYKKTQQFFEVVGYKGSLKAVGRGGGLTGRKLDLAILDDLYKDYAEGNSPLIRKNVIDWYLSVIIKRLHNDSQQLIVFTRWHEEDLIGYIESKQTVKTVSCWDDFEYFKDNPTHWCKINFPTLKIGPPTELDPREDGEAIWPEMHSKEHKLEERALDEEKFDSLEQGDPKPKAGLLYKKGFNTYTRKADFKAIKNYTDIADDGKDFLCSICYGVGIDNYIYVLDIVYTQEPQEETEEQVAEMLTRNRIVEADFESNNGGKGYARAVDRILKGRIIIDWHFQGANKESRVLTNAPTVSKLILMPHNWTEKWPKFARDVLRFRKEFKSNKHDDCADCLTGCYEFSGLAEENSDALYKK